jgi:hypothetical protein
MKKLALVSIVAVCLAFPALALAKKIRVSGGIIGDDNAKLSLNVTKNGDKIKKISLFRASGLNIRCNGETIDGFGFEITGSLPVNDKRTFKARLPNTEDPSEKLRVSGKVKGSGKQVKGNIKTNKLTINGQACDMPKQRFVLKK